MIRSALATLLASMAILAVAPSALAHDTSFPSTITVLDWVSSAGSPSDDLAYGAVESPKRACEGGRTVNVLMKLSGPYELVDVDRTSREGFWMGGGEPNIRSIESKAKVLKKNIGSRGHRHVCSPDAVTWD